MKKLLPCPFCGGEAGIERTGTPRQSCIVACVNCGARHESGDEAQFSGASWNRRTQPAPAITSESGKILRQGASAITSVPLLTDEEIDEHIKTHNEGFIGGMHMVHLCRAIEQAVRSKLGAGVPMTREDRYDAFTAAERAAGENISPWSFDQGVRAAERHHGIVGKEGA